MSVTLLRPSTDLVQGLRNIADQVESGQIKAQHITVVADSKVFHLGTVSNSQAAVNAVWDLNIGLSYMMLAAHGFDV